MKILVINPGSTSTKMAVYEDEKPILLRNITHTAEELAPFDAITEQQDFRKQLVLDELAAADIPLEFDAVIGRGGLVKPIAGGVYEINQQMIDDTLHGCVMHNHACNLGCLIAHEIAASIPGCRSFIADPGVVDELSPLARISGSPLMPRICIWHALNQRAIARRYARGIGKEYEDLNLIICHLGGGLPTNTVAPLMPTTHSMAKGRSRQSVPARCLLPTSSASASAANTLRNSYLSVLLARQDSTPIWAPTTCARFSNASRMVTSTPNSSSRLCSIMWPRTSLLKLPCSAERLTPSC